MAFDDATYQHFLHQTLGRTAALLGWEELGTHYAAVLEEALLVLDVETIDSLTTREELLAARAVGRWLVWRAVAAETAGDFQFSADGGSYSPQQVHEHALAMTAQYEAEAGQYGYGSWNIVTTVPVHYHRDPLRDYDDELAALIDAEGGT